MATLWEGLLETLSVAAGLGGGGIELADARLVETGESSGVGDRIASVAPGQLVFAQQRAILVGVERPGVGLAQFALQPLQVRTAADSPVGGRRLRRAALGRGGWGRRRGLALLLD